MPQLTKEYDTHTGFFVGATGSVIVKLTPAATLDTYGGSNEPIFAGAAEHDPVVTYVNE